MPRERVTAQQSGLDVDVMWSRECGYVQVATTCPSLKRAAEVSREIVAHADAENLGDGEDKTVTSGYHADLDRAGVNRLIRNLRHARDQAFGKDE